MSERKYYVFVCMNSIDQYTKPVFVPMSKTTWYVILLYGRIRDEMRKCLLLTDESIIPLCTEWSITYFVNHMNSVWLIYQTHHVFYHENSVGNLIFSFILGNKLIISGLITWDTFLTRIMFNLQYSLSTCYILYFRYVPILVLA